MTRHTTFGAEIDGHFVHNLVCKSTVTNMAKTGNSEITKTSFFLPIFSVIHPS
jgi:hypothetical protein